MNKNKNRTSQSAQRTTMEKQVWDRLKTVIDPELNIDIVSIGLIYDVATSTSSGTTKVNITMTLTTPGCPLVGVIDTMIRQSLQDMEDFDIDQDLHIELTFDPPWVPDMMSEEAKAELGF